MPTLLQGKVFNGLKETRTFEPSYRETATGLVDL